MKLLKIYFLMLVLILSLGSCVDLLNPEDDYHDTVSRTMSDPQFAEGLLLYGYAQIPTNSYSFNDVATDDAVSSDLVNQYHRVATGEWSAMFDPLSRWNTCLAGIQNVNQFLSVIDTVPWNKYIPEVNSLYKIRLFGEAYAVRAVLQYHLLQTIGGLGADGQMLGIPLYDKSIVAGDNLNVARAAFTASVNKIYADLDKSLSYLTMSNYVNITSASQLPPGLKGVNVANYNTVFGSVYNQRISGRFVKAFKARVALLAASPAFNSAGDAALWGAAANYAGASLQDNGGIAGLDPTGHMFYDATRVNALNVAAATPVDSKEMVLRKVVVLSNTREAANFPPLLFGQGNINPTQNLVDAFPMANGYPISNPLSNFNPANPYAGRDPRLALYIAYNGCTLKGIRITTAVGGGVNAKDSLPTSTRTGYYLRKLLREDVNMNPAATNTQKHYEVHMRYTELFLIYAEAANEAWGPDGTGSNAFSARDVIRAIRKRAGISQPDNYLVSITTKEDMRTLIRNERRLELCFEGFRFWDLRRWKSDLTVAAKGVNIDRTGKVFTVVDVERRAYDNSYMIFGPLPANEVLKFNALVQNKGW